MFTRSCLCSCSAVPLRKLLIRIVTRPGSPRIKSAWRDMFADGVREGTAVSSAS